MVAGFGHNVLRVNPTHSERAAATASLLYVAARSGPLLVDFDGAVAGRRKHAVADAGSVHRLLDAAASAADDILAAQSEFIAALPALQDAPGDSDEQLSAGAAAHLASVLAAHSKSLDACTSAEVVAQAVKSLQVRVCVVLRAHCAAIMSLRRCAGRSEAGG